MTLVLELPDKKEAALKAKAQAQGVSAEQYAQHVLDRDLEESIPAEPRDDRPIWEVIAEVMKDVPDGVFDRLPKDGASQVDHYIYGLPKRS
jgi:hypothetical protein